MESTTNTTTLNNEQTKAKSGRELDIREVCGFLFSKIWIIALVTLCCIIIAFLYTNIVITPMYSSKSEVYVMNKNVTNSNMSTADLTIAQQLTISSKKIFTCYEFCSLVANDLNNLEDVSSFLDTNPDEIKAKKFTDFYFENFKLNKITPETVMSCIGITSDEETCTVQLTVTTPSPELSAIISYTATACMEDYINVMNQANTIGIGALNKGGEIAQSPSNRHPLRNMAIAAVIGFVVVCAILICFFVFDDKIKVPDDIQKHLKLNVLGEIPEIEEA